MKVGGSKYILIPLLAAALLAGCGGGNPPPASSGPAASANVALSTVVRRLSAPLDLQQPNDGSGRLFIVQQGGTIATARLRQLRGTDSSRAGGTDPDPKSLPHQTPAVGLHCPGLETRTSGEYCYLEGQLQRSRKVLVIPGLIQDHNHDLKGLPKATASTATALGSLGRCICRRWFQFASKNFFSPDPNRNTGRDGLAASV